MKKLVMVAMAMVGLAVFAQEQTAPKADANGGAGRGPRMAERRGPRGIHGGMRGMRGGMSGGIFDGMPGDRAVMAVMNPQVADKIGISKEVQEKIRKIDLDSIKVVREFKQKTREAIERQTNLMKEAKPDETAVMAAIDEHFNLRKEMAKAQMKRVLAVKALLTPEQIEAALETLKKMREGKAGRAKPEAAPASAK